MHQLGTLIPWVWHLNTRQSNPKAMASRKDEQLRRHPHPTNPDLFQTTHHNTYIWVVDQSIPRISIHSWLIIAFSCIIMPDYNEFPTDPFVHRFSVVLRKPLKTDTVSATRPDMRLFCIPIKTNNHHKMIASFGGNFLLAGKSTFLPPPLITHCHIFSPYITLNCQHLGLIFNNQH